MEVPHKLGFVGVTVPAENNARHCEPVRRLVWQSPKVFGIRTGLPRRGVAPPRNDMAIFWCARRGRCSRRPAWLSPLGEQAPPLAVPERGKHPLRPFGAPLPEGEARGASPHLRIPNCVGLPYAERKLATGRAVLTRMAIITALESRNCQRRLAAKSQFDYCSIEPGGFYSHSAYKRTSSLVTGCRHSPARQIPILLSFPVNLL